MGAPFLPVRGILGSAYLDVNPRLRVVPNPFAADHLAVVQALSPEVTLIHGSRGDGQGNILIPRTSDWFLAIKASRTVIATLEERVEAPLADQSDWQFIPAIYLSALVHSPGGAAPTGFPGYYPMDENHLRQYQQSVRQPESWQQFLRKHVLEGKF